MAAFTALVLRTKERKGPDGEVYIMKPLNCLGLISGFLQTSTRQGT